VLHLAPMTTATNRSRMQGAETTLYAHSYAHSSSDERTSASV